MDKVDSPAPVTLAANFEFDRKMTNDDPEYIWRKFNNGFTNIEAANASALLDIVRRGHSICAAHAHVHHVYYEKGVRKLTAARNSKNWLPTSTLIFDFDNGEIDMDAVLSSDPLAHEWAYATYNTVSHKPEAPRFRLVFAVEKPIRQLENYQRALRALAHHYQTADPASKNPVHAYAGNKTPSYDARHPNHYLPLTILKQLIEDHEEAERMQALERQRRINAYGNDRLDIAELKRMLQFIPHEGDYMEWFITLSAIYTACGGDPVLATHVAEGWTGGNSRPGEIESRMHRSMTLGKSGEGYLIRRARKHGYVPPFDPERTALRIVRSTLSSHRRQS